MISCPQRNTSMAGGAEEFTNPAQLMYVAVRLWTTAVALHQRELCAILNEAIRNDAPANIHHAAMIAQVCTY